MTKTQGYIIIILLLVALGFPFLGIIKPKQKWEYKVETPMDAFSRPLWIVMAKRDGNWSRQEERRGH